MSFFAFAAWLEPVQMSLVYWEKPHLVDNQPSKKNIVHSTSSALRLEINLQEPFATNTNP